MNQFFIQDPNFSDSKYLHEVLLSQFSSCVESGGAYAFVSKDGVNLLFEDNSFQSFLKNHRFTLIVGMDSITNTETINTLINYQKIYKKLVIKAYLHSDYASSTFHPKFAWFRSVSGGSIVIGSGNLTQKGMRNNREAFVIQNYDEEDFSCFMRTWNAWIAESQGFLFNLSDDKVLKKAEKNGLFSHGINADNTGKLEPKASVDENANEVVSVETENDDDFWKVEIDSKKSDVVLIAEIPNNNKRWSQANFDKKTFEEYFGATCGENGFYRVLLRSVDDNGSLCATESRPSVSVASQNYRFELAAAKGLEYPSAHPIAVFYKVSPRNFLYQLLMPGCTSYDEAKAMLDKTREELNSNGTTQIKGRCRRYTYSSQEAFGRMKNLSLWKRQRRK